MTGETPISHKDIVEQYSRRTLQPGPEIRPAVFSFCWAHVFRGDIVSANDRSGVIKNGDLSMIA